MTEVGNLAFRLSSSVAYQLQGLCHLCLAYFFLSLLFLQPSAFSTLSRTLATASPVTRFGSILYPYPSRHPQRHPLLPLSLPAQRRRHR